MKKSFTLIELMVVVAIIAILAGISTWSVSASLRKARDARRREDVRTILKAFDAYYLKTGSYKLSDYGSNGSGLGWFNRTYSSVYPSLAEGLIKAGVLKDIPIEPQFFDSGTSLNSMTQRDYYITLAGPSKSKITGICVFAILEEPKDYEQQGAQNMWGTSDTSCNPYGLDSKVQQRFNYGAKQLIKEIGG